ncbi:reductive dehalogenase [Chloroflexota bacterium]
MPEKQNYGEILTGKKQLGQYPMEKLKRVDRLTTRVTSDIKRFDYRNMGFHQAEVGHFGEEMYKAFWRDPEPIYSAERWMTGRFKGLVDGAVADSEASLPQDPAALSRHIKKLGYFFGADIVGICGLPQWAVYSHDGEGNPIELPHKYAIVLLYDQDYETMKASTGHDWVSRDQSTLSYVHCAMLTCMMADYIRKLGYPARAHHLVDEQVLMPPLVALAGLGEISRTGVALNPFLGLRFKSGVITTDLPLLPDKPIDFGLQEFCSKCGKCAEKCPAQAITYGDKVMHNGYEIWELDYERCLRFRLTNPKGSGCGTCIRVCPWNKPDGWTHDAVRWMTKNTPWMDNFIIKMDDVWGYGKADTRGKWWFDLEEENGSYKLPKNNKKV